MRSYARLFFPETPNTRRRVTGFACVYAPADSGKHGRESPEKWRVRVIRERIRERRACARAATIRRRGRTARGLLCSRVLVPSNYRRTHDDDEPSPNKRIGFFFFFVSLLRPPLGPTLLRTFFRSY